MSYDLYSILDANWCGVFSLFYSPSTYNLSIQCSSPIVCSRTPSTLSRDIETCAIICLFFWPLNQSVDDPFCKPFQLVHNYGSISLCNYTYASVDTGRTSKWWLSTWRSGCIRYTHMLPNTTQQQQKNLQNNLHDDQVVWDNGIIVISSGNLLPFHSKWRPKKFKVQ